MVGGSFYTVDNAKYAEIEYMFDGRVLGPVLVPWYYNHGLNRSQQFLQFFGSSTKKTQAKLNADEEKKLKMQ